MDWTGRTIDGRYAVTEVLGTGGMGVVLRARHQFTGEDVAVKMLKPSLELEADLQARFLAESKMPSAIGHPGIVRVLDAGVTPDGSLYLVMELLRGRTLREALGSGEVPPAEAQRIALELLDALGAAHASGFVHRDLKPENVFIAGPSRTVKLLDFGIAKTIAAGIATPRTAAGIVLGTMAYMAPEQLRDARSVDARADLWAVGVMIYEALAGRLPFVAATMDSLAAAVAGSEPEPIGRFVPDASPELHAFFARALARAPAARFATAAEMASAVSALPLAAGTARTARERRPIDATAPTVASTPSPAPVLNADSTRDSAASRPARSSRARWFTIGGGLAVAIAAVIAVAIRSSAPGAAKDSTNTQSTAEVPTEVTGVTARIAYARVRDGVLRVGVLLHNATDRRAGDSKALRYTDMFVVDRTARQKLSAFQSADGMFVAGPISDGNDGGRWFPSVQPQSETLVWAMFPAPPDGHPIDLHVPLAPSFDGIAVDTSSPPATVPCAMAPLTATLVTQTRSDGMLTVELAIENPGSRAAGFSQAIRYRDAYVLDPVHRKRYGVVSDASGALLASPISDASEHGRWFAHLEAGRRIPMKIVFEAPPDPVDHVDIVLPFFAPFESVALTGSGGSRDVGTALASQSSNLAP